MFVFFFLSGISYVFWFGDLNFRLTDEDELSHADIKKLIEQDHLEQLIQRDQLSMIRRQGRAFTRLEERLPAFPPTFKFEHGTSDYDPKLVYMVFKIDWPFSSVINVAFVILLIFFSRFIEFQTTTSLV